MARDLDSKISTYLDHFKLKVSRLRDYQLDPEDKLLKKNILVSILDAVSRTTSNPTARNRERFVGLIRHFGDWPEHSRVSAPHLSFFLKFLRDPSFENIRIHVQSIIAKNSTGEFVPLSNDPELEEIRDLWPVPAEQKLVGKLSLSSFTHLNLFYEYRNSLVHELREPGYGMEFHNEHTDPFYHGMTTVDSDDAEGEETLELVYPLNFYFRIVDNVLENLDAYLHKNQIDPYTCYQFGSSWVGELNE